MVRASLNCLSLNPSWTDLQCRSWPAEPDGGFHALFLITERSGSSGKFIVYCFLNVRLVRVRVFPDCTLWPIGGS